MTALPASWGVVASTLIASTPTSRVHRVRLTDGGSAVVKELTQVGIESELPGAELLRWREGAGYVRLLAADGPRLLLEDAGERSLLSHLESHGDDAATLVAADALRAMHAPVPGTAPTGLLPLAEHFMSLFDLAARGADPLVVEAAEVARRLLDSPVATRPLHGDFHHENLFETDRGWLAIDPKGVIGDPAYEAVNLFYNPLDRDDLRLDPDRIARMARLLAPAVGRDVTSVLGWGFAHACLSASWHLEDGEPELAASSLQVAAALRGVLRAVG
jgi:streptomycin 6-kinase